MKVNYLYLDSANRESLGEAALAEADCLAIAAELKKPEGERPPSGLLFPDEACAVCVSASAGENKPLRDAALHSALRAFRTDCRHSEYRGFTLGGETDGGAASLTAFLGRNFMPGNEPSDGEENFQQANFGAVALAAWTLQAMENAFGAGVLKWGIGVSSDIVKRESGEEFDFRNWEAARVAAWLSGKMLGRSRVAFERRSVYYLDSADFFYDAFDECQFVGKGVADRNMALYHESDAERLGASLGFI